MQLKNSVCMEKFDFMPSLGRFTLRDEGKTIGYGTVLKIKPAKNLTKEQKNQLGPKHEEMIKKTE
jgi:GH24 family phage-related lysozyme (muramidase)